MKFRGPTRCGSASRRPNRPVTREGEFPTYPFRSEMAIRDRTALERGGVNVMYLVEQKGKRWIRAKSGVNYSESVENLRRFGGRLPNNLWGSCTLYYTVYKSYSVRTRLWRPPVFFKLFWNASRTGMNGIVLLIASSFLLPWKDRDEDIECNKKRKKKKRRYPLPGEIRESREKQTMFHRSTWIAPLLSRSRLGWLSSTNHLRASHGFGY